jgi:hypothetical protein
MEQQEPKARRKRSGSEKRKRLPPFPLRLLPDERARIEVAADGAGLTLGSYIRSRTLDAPTTQPRRRASVDLAALAKALAVVNKMGGNLHQIAKYRNFGGAPLDEEIHAALRGYEQMVMALLLAIGMHR